MGAFGIYVAILTFIYIVYYAAMIGMDVVGSNGKKKAEVEEFAVGNAPDKVEPVYIIFLDDRQRASVSSDDVLNLPHI